MDANPDPRTCLDCNAPLVHAGGKGRWPERCPEHRAAHALRTHRDGKRARKAAVEHNCLDCATPLTRSHDRAKWPVRCPGCQVVRTQAIRKPYQPRPRGFVVACPDCGASRQVARNMSQPGPCADCAAERQRVYARGRRASALGAEARWRERNPEKVMNLRHRRRANKTADESDFIEIAVLLERDGHNCYLCSLPLDLDAPWPQPQSKSLDHVVPISAGGTHTYDNVRLAHLGCNIAKGAKMQDIMLPTGTLTPVAAPEAVHQPRAEE